MTNTLKSIQIPLLLLGVFVAFLGVIDQRVRILPFYNRIMIWPVLNIATAIVSFFILNDTQLLVNALAMLFIFVTFLMWFTWSRSFINGIDGLMFVLFVIVTMISLAVVPFSLKNYTGMFYNLNSLGGIYCCFLTYFIATISSNKNRKGLKIACLIISIFMVVVSSSRGAFVSSAAVFALWVLLEIYQNGHMSVKRAWMMLVIIFIMAGIYKFTPLHTIIDNSIVSKFVRKANDTTSGRIDIWRVVWEERTLFGHGRNYFDAFRWGAHNTFVSLLGQYGIMGAFSYIGLFLTFLMESFKHFKNNKDYAPLLFVICFLSLSMIEGMLMKIHMFLMYYGITCCIRSQKEAYTGIAWKSKFR
ncbi:MAG: hypothetical protein J1E01_00645 [Acetatifactor sp.]|nr:hypothetical protein [Acetatifactor sp.]